MAADSGASDSYQILVGQRLDFSHMLTKHASSRIDCLRLSGGWLFGNQRDIRASQMVSTLWPIGEHYISLDGALQANQPAMAFVVIDDNRGSDLIICIPITKQNRFLAGNRFHIIPN